MLSSRRYLRAFTSLAMVFGVVVAVQFVGARHSSPARANPPTGTAGEFTSAQGAVLDTRTGLGTSGTVAPFAANTWHQVGLAGVAGIPSSGVSSVQIAVTAINPAATGYISAAASGNHTLSGGPAPVAALLYTGGAGNISATSIIPVDATTHIEVLATTTTDVHIDVQGYYTAGNGTTAPGGFVPVNPTRIVDTRTGTGLPQAKLAVNSASTIQVGGLAGVPPNASAVFAMITAVNTSNATAGYYTAYPTGTTQPAGVSTSYTASTSTVAGTAVGLGTGGQFTFKVGPNGGSIDLVVDVLGYFTATTSASGAFTPQDQRVYDTRVAPATILAANSGRQVQVAGQNGIPLPPTGVSAYAVNVQVIHSGSSASYLALGETSSSTDTTVYFPAGTSTRNSLVATRAGDDGTIYLLNNSADPIDVVLDVEGYYQANNALPQLSGPVCGWSGTVLGTQPLTHQLTDFTSMSVNPVSGNLLLTQQLLHLRGVEQDLSIGWRYNSRNDTRPSLNTGLFETALQPWTDGSFVYTAPDGSCYRFKQSGSSWTTPAGINATLTQDSNSHMLLRFNPSGITNVYVFNNGVWVLRQSQDKNTSPNLITYTYSSGKLASITDTQGRVVNFAYADPNNSLQPSSITDTSLSRTIGLTYGGPSGALSQVTDATGAHTNLTYDANGLSSLTDDNGHITHFGYNSSTDQLTSWAYGYGSSDTVAGGTDESDWAASYDSTAQTTITDGRSQPWVYSIDGAGRVTGIKDPNLNTTTSDWAVDGTNDLKSRTDALTETTNYSYGGSGNPNNLLSKVTSPNGAGSTSLTGASQSLSFPTSTTGQIGDYQPNGTTDAQGNTTSISYGGNSHQPTSHSYYKKVGQNQVLVPGAESATYGGDTGFPATKCPNVKNGEVCTSTDANGNETRYSYDTSGNVTTVTPPAPLGAKTYTYDAAGRVTSASDGRGNTAYISYDADDRTTQVSYASGSCSAATCVSYTFDGAGNLTSRTSATETTTFGYDALNRPQTKSRGSLTISTAIYDQASNLVKYTDASGSVVYGYDAGNQLISLAEPGGSCSSNPGKNPAPNSTKCTYFQNDKANRRTAVIYPSGQNVLIGYDHASRITSITSSTYSATGPGPGVGGTVLTARNYTYALDSAGNDQALLDHMVTDAGVGGGAGVQTTYTYTDGRNRLTSASIGGVTTTWAYDANSNRTKAQVGTATPTYSAYNGADEICWTSSAATAGTAGCTAPPAGATTYGFDASGNQTGDDLAGNTATNAFNVFNQVTSSTVAGIGSLADTYTDTTNTERLTAGATSFLNGTLGMTSQTSGGTTINYIRDPFGGLIALHTSTSGSYYYTTDAQGSAILLTNSNQTIAAKYTYDVWGNPTSATGTYATINPWRYAGGYLDPTGYTKLGARYYNPSTGRFTQPDPSHQETNNYTYAGANPANNTDPSGLFSWGDAFKVAAIGVGATAIFASGFGAVAALGVAATALDVTGGALNGESGGELAGDAIVDLATTGIGLAGEGAEVSGSSKYLLNGTAFAANAAYASGPYYGG